MMDDTTYQTDVRRSGHGIHLPSLADPMMLLDELKRRLDHCETVTSAHLVKIQRRLNALEDNVRSIRADIGGGARGVELELVRLADRLARLENGSQ